MRPSLICAVTILLSTVLTACGEDQKPTSTPPVTPAQEERANPSPETQSVIEPQTETPPQESQAETEAQTPTAEQAPEPSPTETAAADEDPNQASLELARKSGCLACHAIDKKVVGPAWADVAKRYASDPNAKAKLKEKVAKGGRGNWTDVVGNMAMPPYSPRVPDQDIEALVEFVLALNKP